MIQFKIIYVLFNHKNKIYLNYTNRNNWKITLKENVMKTKRIRKILLEKSHIASGIGKNGFWKWDLWRLKIYKDSWREKLWFWLKVAKLLLRIPSKKFRRILKRNTESQSHKGNAERLVGIAFGIMLLATKEHSSY